MSTAELQGMRKRNNHDHPPGIVQPGHLEYCGACPVQRGNTGLGRKVMNKLPVGFLSGSDLLCESE